VRLRSSQRCQGVPRRAKGSPKGAQGRPRGPKGSQKVTKKASKMAPRMGPGPCLDPGTDFFTKNWFGACLCSPNDFQKTCLSNGTGSAFQKGEFAKPYPQSLIYLSSYLFVHLCICLYILISLSIYVCIYPCMYPSMCLLSTCVFIDLVVYLCIHLSS